MLAVVPLLSAELVLMLQELVLQELVLQELVLQELEFPELLLELL